MAGKRRKSRTPRVVLVDVREIRELRDIIEDLMEQVTQLRRLGDDLVSMKTKRKASARAAHETRRRNQAGPTYPPGTEFCEYNATSISPVPNCVCNACIRARHAKIQQAKKPLDKTEEIHTLDKSGNGRPNEKDSSGEQTESGEVSQAVESVLDKKDTELETILREQEAMALSNGFCLTTHEWPPTEECECPNCLKYDAERTIDNIIDWTLRRP